MPLDIETGWPELAASAAFYTATNVVTLIEPTVAQPIDWPHLGEPDGAAVYGWTRLMVRTEFATFVACNPTAPAEALYRFACGRGIHNGEPGGFDGLPAHWRLAYAAFAASLPVYDRLLKAEVAAIEAARAASAGAPIAAALTEVPIEQTILAQLPDPLATNPNMVLAEVVQTSGAAAAMAASEATIVADPDATPEPVLVAETSAATAV